MWGNLRVMSFTPIITCSRSKITQRLDDKIFICTLNRILQNYRGKCTDQFVINLNHVVSIKKLSNIHTVASYKLITKTCVLIICIIQLLVILCIFTMLKKKTKKQLYNSFVFV